MKIVPAQAVEFFAADSGTDVAAYLSGTDLAAASLATCRFHGRHPRRTNTRSVKLCYVVQGRVTVDCGNERHELRAGDAFQIEPGEPHAMSGWPGKIVMVCVPAFDPADEQVEEEPWAGR